MGFISVRSMPRKWTLLLLFLCVVSCSYYVAMSYFAIDLRPHTLFYSIWDPVGNRGNGVTWRQLALQVAAVRHELETARVNGNPPSIHAINSLERILGQLDSALFATESHLENDTVRTIDVCPEVYTNGTYGWPFYEIGWVKEDCAEAPPLNKVISVVLNPSFDSPESCSKYLSWVLQGLNETYPTVSVYIADQTNCTTVSESFPNVRRIRISSSASRSSIWSSLISSVTTPYVLVARDLFHFTFLTGLEREIRIISSNKRIRIAGGALRNLTGHWKVGCFQTSMKNYILEFTEGYHVSQNECMLCDHLAGPFVAKTQVFHEIPLDTSLPEELLFHDFFLQVKNAGYLVVNCPDVMYFANDMHHLVQNEEKIWIPLVRKWELNYILLPKRVKYTFSCTESGISCKFMTSKVRSFLLAPCCLQQFVTGLKVLRDLKVSFEVDSGTVLAAVKLQGNSPWDIDADTIYLSANHTFLLSAKEHIAHLGLQLEERDSVRYGSSGNPKGGYFMLWTPDGNIEMYGVGELSSSSVLPPELRSIPTKVELNGEWFDGPTSPGLYARNRYGSGILKHAQSWRFQGLNTSYAKEHIAHLGLQLEERDSVRYGSSGNPKGGYFMLWTPDGNIEMYGVGELSSSSVLPPELRSIPTKVELNGEWFDGPTSPGLYARNRYGSGILKHAQSWRFQGLNTSYGKYKVGAFLPCQKLNHHACLDRFAGDGNIQFKTP